MRNRGGSTAIGALILVACVSGCGSGDADTEATASAPSVATTHVASDVSTTIPAVPAPVGTSTAEYEVTAGDTLYGISSAHCTTIDVVTALSGWTDGADHPIYPADTILVPGASCSTLPSSGAPPTTTTDASGSGVMGMPVYSLWGDPSDYGAIYGSDECTELRLAGNELKSVYGPVENQEPAQRFLAAVSAMSDPPSASVRGAIERSVAIYTRFAPVWAQVESDATSGLAVADNPVWTDAWATIVASETERDTMWRYVEETCPAIGNSED